MSKIFISRNLKPTSLFKKELAGLAVEIIGQSLIDFSPIPFNNVPVADWIFFYSKNGVKFFLETLATTIYLQVLAEENLPLKWATIGKGTAEALIAYQIQPDFIGNGEPKAVAQAFGKIAKGKEVLFPRAKNSKKSVQQLLKKQVEVKDLVVYKNEIKNNITIPTCDVLVFTSPLNTQAYFQKYTLLPEQKVIAIGKTTQKALQVLGIKNGIVAEQSSEIGLAQSIIKLQKI